MSEEASRTGGLWMPYPLLGILLTMVLVLGGGIIGLYATVISMNATMIMRDATYQQNRAEDRRQIELLQVYVNNDREKLVRLEEQIKNKQGKSN